MNHKVVYNDCFGGYDLSDEAIDMLHERGYNYDHYYEYIYEIPRHNKDLVDVIETLGPSASTENSNIKIKELPEGCRMYKIREYDGKETVIPVMEDEIVIID